MDTHGLSKLRREGKEATFNEIGQGSSSEAELTVFKETGQGSSFEAERTVFKDTGRMKMVNFDPLTKVEVGCSFSHRIFLVEVFKISMVYIEDLSDLYGTITVFYAGTKKIIYNRSRENPERIHSGQQITLTGPSHAILKCDVFGFDFNLKSKASDQSADKEIIINKVSPYDSYMYDTDLVEAIEGKHGVAKIDYYVPSFSRAVTVKLNLIHLEKGNSVNLWGKVTACAIKFHEVTLLDLGRSQHVCLRVNDKVPLFRNVVVVPTTSNLIIRANLHSSNKLLQGSYECTIQPLTRGSGSGTTEDFINYKFGQFKVTAVWTVL